MVLGLSTLLPAVGNVRLSRRKPHALGFAPTRPFPANFDPHFLILTVLNLNELFPAFLLRLYLGHFSTSGLNA